jgi:hypothetical protein
MRAKILPVIAMVLGALTLAGCGHYHHGHHDKYYGYGYGYHYDDYYYGKHDKRGCDAYRCPYGKHGGYGYGYGYDDDNGYGGKHHYKHHGHRVCDGDGDRCYYSDEPYWDHRKYYRRHGYHWLDD